MKYDVVIIGAGPGGIFSAYELMKQNNDLKIAVFEAGNPLSKRHCPIDGDKVKTCIKCKTCAIMSGFGAENSFPSVPEMHPHLLRWSVLPTVSNADPPCLKFYVLLFTSCPVALMFLQICFIRMKLCCFVLHLLDGEI